MIVKWPNVREENVNMRVFAKCRGNRTRMWCVVREKQPYWRDVIQSESRDNVCRHSV